MQICNLEGVWSSDQGDAITDLEEKKKFCIKQSDAYAALLRAKILAPASPYEASSWPLKLAEAKDGINTPMLDLEAQHRGIDRTVLIQKVLDKAQQLAELESIISGINGKHTDIIKTLTSLQEVQDYDWRNLYPPELGW